MNNPTMDAHVTDNASATATITAPSTESVPDSVKRAGKLSGKLSGNRLSMRLDTLLLIMTLAAIVVAYFVADQNREAWEQRLSRLETAVGLPRIRDVRNIEVAPMRNAESWSIWVPANRQVKLYLATEELDATNPRVERECLLKPGRNVLKIYKPAKEPSAALALNNEDIFSRTYSRLWNINTKYWATNKEYEVVTKPMRLFQSLSSVRLEVDEEFDPVKHRCGLRIWIEP